MKKKLLMLLVTAALALVALPMAAFADGEVAAIGDKKYSTLQEAVNDALDNTQTTITLLGDASGDGVIVPSNKMITFDLAESTYTIDGKTVGSSGTETNGFQLLKGSTIVFKNGGIKSTSNTCNVLIQNYSNLTLESVMLDGQQLAAGANSYVLSNNNGSVQLTGKTSINAPAGGVAFDMYYWPSNGYTDGVKVTVNTTGTITGKIEYAKDNTSTDADAAKNNVLNIENIQHEGTFNVTVKDANINVSGGIFSNEVPDAYLKDGFAPTLNPDTGKYEVAKLPVVATVDGTDYGTLEEAMEAAKKMTGDVTVTVLKDIQVTDSTYDLSGTGLTSLTLQGKTGAEKLISGVDGNGIDGPIYCPVIRVKLPQNAGLTVNRLVFPNDLLFDSQDGRVLVKNCTFNGAQSGYPQAAAIRYEGNLFEFKGTAGNFYSQNAYPVWYKVDKPLDFDFVGNTVIGYRGVHIETRGDDAVAADIQVDKNTFRLSDSQYPSKAVALQLVSNIRGKVSFVDNNVDGYMGVCFYDGVKVGNNAEITVGNNYLADGTKLYGVSEWNAPGGDVTAAEERLQAQLEGKATINATHTHTYQNGECTVCGAQEPRPDPKPDAPAATPAPAPVLDSTPKTGAVSLVALPLAALALTGVGVALRKRR